MPEDPPAVTKAQRVAVLRAMRRVCELHRHLRLMDDRGPQGQMIVYDCTRPLSYGLAWLKANWCYRYQWTDPVWGRGGKTEEALRAMLAPGGRNHGHVQPGGAWWRRCQIAAAEMAGDADALAALQAEQDAATAAIYARFGVSRSGPPGSYQE